MITELEKKHTPQWREAVEVKCTHCDGSDLDCLWCLGRGYYFNTKDYNGNVYEKGPEDAALFLNIMSSGPRQRFLAELRSPRKRIRNNYRRFI